MATVNYKALSSLTPVNLSYTYNSEDTLQSSLVSYKEGINFYSIAGAKGYEDISINSGTCLVLTSAISLSNIFNTSQSLQFNNLPVAILLQPRTSSSYVSYITDNSLFGLDTTGDVFYVSPINDGTGDVQLFVNNRYVQVDTVYPFNLLLATNNLINDINIGYTQRFKLIYQNGYLTILANTPTDVLQKGYVCIGNDKILRATGVVLNDSAPNDYVFKCIPVSLTNLNSGFIPTNDWVTYYYDIESGSDNKTLNVNKDFTNTQTNYLLNFSIETATAQTSASINVSNLKTYVTPTGGPAPVDNTYTKTVITRN
jgi:hypothetical protein